MATLSFDGFVNIAVRIVTEKYPQARLYEANGTSSTGPVTDARGIDQLRVVFRNENNSTVIIKSTTWGEFGEPTLIPHPWMEDVVINWPVPMDLPEAISLKDAAGYAQPFANVTLRNPLGPVAGNPYFIFGTNMQSPYIFVDTVTKKVHATSVQENVAAPAMS